MTDLITIENPPPGLLLPGVLVTYVNVRVTGVWLAYVQGYHNVAETLTGIHYTRSVALVLSHPDHDASLSRHRVRDHLKERGHEVTTDDPVELRDAFLPAMPDLVTLPGTIPGLLRRCSPVIFTEAGTSHVCRAVVEGIQDGHLIRCLDDAGMVEIVDTLAADLDLSDPTGRFHAVLWLSDRLGYAAGELLLNFECGDWIELSAMGSHSVLGWGPDTEVLSPTEALRDLCLHVHNQT